MTDTAKRAAAPALEYPRRAFLDLSTNAVSKETADWLNGNLAGEENGRSLTGAITQHGWFVHVPADPDTNVVETDGLPEDLALCLARAGEMGCDYVLFEGDATTDFEALGLTEYDWE